MIRSLLDLPLTDRAKDALVCYWAFGWVQIAVDCLCGGDLAWAKPRPSGAYELVGCVCHQTPRFRRDLLLEMEAS